MWLAATVERGPGFDGICSLEPLWNRELRPRGIYDLTKLQYGILLEFQKCRTVPSGACSEWCDCGSSPPVQVEVSTDKVFFNDSFTYSVMIIVARFQPITLANGMVGCHSHGNDPTSCVSLLDRKKDLRS